MDTEMVNVLLKYIVEEAYGLVPALWFIGWGLKNTPKIKNWTIVWILMPLGILGAIGLLGVNADAIIQGINITGVSVLGHQLLTQTVYKNSNNLDKEI